MSENVENKEPQDKLGEMKEKAEDMLHKATDKAEELWDKTEDKAGEVWTDVKEKAADLAEGAKGLWNKVVDKFDGDDEAEKPAEKQ